MLPVAWSKIIITTLLFVSYSSPLACSTVLLSASLPLSLSLSLSLSLPYTRPKVQAHHLLIRQKECNEIINVLELIMNMIKKAKISGAEISLPIQSQGLLSFRKRQKKLSTRPGSNSPLCPCMELFFTLLLCP